MSSRMLALRPRRIEAHITALVLVVHLANALVAAWMGYLSPDAWYYLRLANSFFVNGYPSLHETAYYARFPFGYPLLLALASPALDLAQIAVVSKFVNAGLWISAYFVLKSLRMSPVLAAAVVATPFSLWIGARTWSENLMLLALIMTLAGIDRLQWKPSHGRGASILFLLAGLLLGIASRYVFGFVILGFAAAYLVAFRQALRPLPFVVFAVSEGFFMLYLLVNARHTGYSTGMERIAATEDASYLAFTFAQATSQLLLTMLLPVAAIALLTARRWEFKPLAIMAALAGGAYVAIITYLRWHRQFDPLDQRLLGPGWLLLAVALALAARTPEPEGRRPLALLGLLLLALGAGYWVHGETARDLIKRGEAWTSPTQVLRSYAQGYRGEDKVTSVVSVYVPSPRASVDPNPLYYGDLTVFIPGSAPFRRRETLDAFRGRVLGSGADIDQCAVDFTQLASEAQLSQTVDARYRSGLTKVDARFDPTLAARFHKMFRPNAFVPCRELLMQ